MAVRQAEVTARALICAGFRGWVESYEVLLCALRAYHIQRQAAARHP